MKRLLIAVGAAGALFAGGVASAAPNASPSAAPASAIGSGSTSSSPAANAGTASTLAANPAVVGAPAAPPLPSNGKGCVGGIVSTAAHFWQQTTDQGLGDVAHDTGQNVGKAIQAAATTVCGKH